jgi:hypothetical protein
MPQNRLPGSPEARIVRYGGWMFSAPAPFVHALPPNCAGLYAVQVLNPAWRPCPFEPIFFGEALDLTGQAVGAAHPAFARWIAHPRAGTGLFVSYAALPCTREDVLHHIVGGLIATYRPAANQNGGSAHGLLGLAG